MYIEDPGDSASARERVYVDLHEYETYYEWY